MVHPTAARTQPVVALTPRHTPLVHLAAHAAAGISLHCAPAGSKANYITGYTPGVYCGGTLHEGAGPPQALPPPSPRLAKAYGWRRPQDCGDCAIISPRTPPGDLVRDANGVLQFTPAAAARILVDAFGEKMLGDIAIVPVRPVSDKAAASRRRSPSSQAASDYRSRPSLASLSSAANNRAPPRPILRSHT